MPIGRTFSPIPATPEDTLELERLAKALSTLGAMGSIRLPAPRVQGGPVLAPPSPLLAGPGAPIGGLGRAPTAAVAGALLGGETGSMELPPIFSPSAMERIRELGRGREGRVAPIPTVTRVSGAPPVATAQPVESTFAGPMPPPFGPPPFEPGASRTPQEEAAMRLMGTPDGQEIARSLPPIPGLPAEILSGRLGGPTPPELREIDLSGRRDRDIGAPIAPAGGRPIGTPISPRTIAAPTAPTRQPTPAAPTAPTRQPTPSILIAPRVTGPVSDVPLFGGAMMLPGGKRPVGYSDEADYSGMSDAELEGQVIDPRAAYKGDISRFQPLPLAQVAAEQERAATMYRMPYAARPLRRAQPEPSPITSAYEEQEAQAAREQEALRTPVRAPALPTRLPAPPSPPPFAAPYMGRETRPEAGRMGPEGNRAMDIARGAIRGETAQERQASRDRLVEFFRDLIEKGLF